MDSAAFGSLGQFANIIEIVYANRDPSLFRQRHQPLDLADARYLIRHQYVWNAALDQNFRFRNLLTTNPNGAERNIAGIVNAQGNVFGMMPHPERALEPAHGNTDGRRLFEGLLEAVA